MSIYLRLVRLSFQQQITYRTSLIAGLVTNAVFGLFRIFMLLALLNGQAQVNGFSTQSVYTFTAISQGLIAYISLFGYWDIMRSVYSGDVGSDLLKPIRFFSFWLAKDFGRSLVNLLLRGVLLLAIYSFFFTIELPRTLEQWLALPFILFFGWLVSFAWRFLVSLSAFWTHDGIGVGRLAYTVSQMFCGFIMPLSLMPDWFIKFTAFTPFPSMLNTIIDLFLGKLQGVAILYALLTQLFWFVVLASIGQLVLRLAVRRLVIQGG